MSLDNELRYSGRSARGRATLRLAARRLGNALGTLLVIAYLTSWGLILAERGRQHLPALRPGASLRDWRRPHFPARNRGGSARAGDGQVVKDPLLHPAYDPNGLALEQFNYHPSTVSTVVALSPLWDPKGERIKA